MDPLRDDIRRHKEEIIAKLRNGDGRLTTRQLAWLMLSLCEDMEEIRRMHAGCPALKAWQESKPLRDRALTVIFSAALAGLFWAALQAMINGFRLP